MVRNNEIGARPNKYWPVVAAVVAICLFGFLTVTNQKHATQSGDNIHKFANGGLYRDGSKSIKYNCNNPRAYNGSSSNNTFSQLFLPVLLIGAALYAYLWFTRPDCSVTCRGDCCRSYGG
uniref:13K Protein n=1 Tax=Potato mop-top virus TaxID=37128 RepID=Q85292_9VIRU|nr:triple gene block protein 2 [Potato mop-top virus]BAA06413.1 13K Protein [Potato mop-top virus]